MPGNESCFRNCKIFVSGVNVTFQALSCIPKGGLWTEPSNKVLIQFNTGATRGSSRLVARAFASLVALTLAVVQH